MPRNAIHSSGFFSETRFDSLEICEPLKKDNSGFAVSSVQQTKPNGNSAVHGVCWK